MYIWVHHIINGRTWYYFPFEKLSSLFLNSYFGQAFHSFSYRHQYPLYTLVLCTVCDRRDANLHACRTHTYSVRVCVTGSTAGADITGHGHYNNNDDAHTQRTYYIMIILYRYIVPTPSYSRADITHVHCSTL